MEAGERQSQTEDPKQNKRKYQKVDLNRRSEIIRFAESHSNREAARKFGIDEKAIRKWRKPEKVIFSWLVVWLGHVWNLIYQKSVFRPRNLRALRTSWESLEQISGSGWMEEDGK